MRHGALVERKPSRRASEQKRWLYVTPEIHEYLQGKQVDSGFPDGEANGLINVYLLGQYITVALKHKNKARPELERLEDVNEIWVLCFRKPRPGWRLLGRFVQRDVFVGVSLRDRFELARRSNYQRLAVEFEENWETILPNITPIKGNIVGDYLSGVFRDVLED